MAPQIYPRVAGRIGNFVNLNMNTLRNGQPETPYALRRIDIYRGSPRPGQLVSTVVFPDPDSTTYPDPASETSIGRFSVPFLVPEDFIPCEVYFDVWHFLGRDPETAGIDDESLWISQSGMFWVFDDTWIGDEDLQTKRLGFEPLDKRLRRGEIRTIEVAMHPLPMYEYDFNKFAPMVPQFNPTMTLWTARDELLVQDAQCKIGVRQGANRNSPFVVQCTVDTQTLVRGMYKYVIKINIDDDVIISPKFNFMVQ